MGIAPVLRLQTIEKKYLAYPGRGTGLILTGNPLLVAG
jgi:hypothetical protein